MDTHEVDILIDGNCVDGGFSFVNLSIIMRITLLTVLLATTGAFIVAPRLPSHTYADRYATVTTPRSSAPQARVLSLARNVWARCTFDSCSVGPPRPIVWIKSLIPRRRPLTRLCAAGLSNFLPA